MINTVKKVVGNSPKQWAMFSFGLYFLVLLHYFQFNHGGSGLNHPMNPLGWIIVSIIIGCGLLQIANKGEFRYNTLSRNIGIGCLILLIPLAYSGDTGWYSHQRLLGLFAGLALLFAIQQLQLKRQDYFKLFSIIVVAALIESTISLVQFYVLPYFPQLNLNLSRPSALFFQPNVAASFYTMGLLFSIILLQRDKHAKPSFISLYYLCCLTCSIAIVLLQSRTGYVAAIITMLLLLCFRSSVNKKWFLTIVVGAVIAITSLNFLDRYTRDSEVYGHPGLRSQIYTSSLEIIANKPIQGHGYGSFAHVYIEHQATRKNEFKPTYQLGHPHNEILLWLIEGGMISAIGLLVMVFTIIIAIFKPKNQRILNFILLLPLALHSLTEFPFYQSVASWIVFILCCAFIQSKTLKISFSTSKTVVYTFCAILLISLTTLYMSSILVSQKRISNVLYTQDGSELLNTELPFLSTDFIELRNKDKLKISLSRGITSEVIRYFEWATKLNNVFPRSTRYKNQLLAALYLKKFDDADRTLSEAKRLFPTLMWTEQEQWIINRKNEIKRTN